MRLFSIVYSAKVDPSSTSDGLYENSDPSSKHRFELRSVAIPIYSAFWMRTRFKPCLSRTRRLDEGNSQKSTARLPHFHGPCVSRLRRPPLPPIRSLDHNRAFGHRRSPGDVLFSKSIHVSCETVLFSKSESVLVQYSKLRLFEGTLTTIFNARRSGSCG